MELKKTCQAGEVIFSKGDESTEAYLINSGRVEITLHTENGALSVARLGPGEFFGEMGMIGNKPRTATATALGPTELAVITEEGFDKAVLQNQERLKTYLCALFERLRTTDTMLEMERQGHRVVPAPVAPAALAAAGGKGHADPIVKMTSARPNPVTHKIISVNVDRFPFRIGRAEEKVSLFSKNDLAIPDALPLQLSRHHAAIGNGGGKCFVTDLGSRIGTVVNGVPIGVRAGAIVAELKPGDNTVVFGQADNSPHIYTINVSAGS